VALKQDRSETSVESVVVTARIAPETHEALRAIADHNYRSISSHVRSLIEADVAARPSRGDTEQAA
jgi:predicted HicB family RNase H-like nuclease